MQDRFKFRVWSKANNKYCHHITTDLSADGLLRVLRPLEKSEYIDDWEHQYDIQQCTGLKDKNGKLIYVGDILYNPFSNYKYVVNFGKFTLNYTKPFSVNIIGFYITYKENIKNEIDSLQMLDLNNIEVIGDVYQNPELLED